MKIVRIIGGLGNQMFQYAFACRLSHLYPSEKILIDISSFETYKTHKYELDNVFNLTLPKANKLQCFLVKFKIPQFTTKEPLLFLAILLRRFFKEKHEKQFSVDLDALSRRGTCYYDGYWFNQGYFEDIKHRILKEFNFKQALSADNEILKKSIDSINSISIHVRRGDYLLYDEFKGICERTYYEKAITYVKNHVKNPHFFIFSNDIQWCKDNLLGLMDAYTIAENKNPQNNYVDMQLMSCCKHNIIAHSSFSWWAAWLNTNPDKIVVAPKKWINDDSIQGKPQLDSWILIE